MNSIILEDDRWCFACGEKNPHGLKLAFELGDDEVLRSSFTFRKEHQGYTGIVHGGLVGLVLDEMMLNLAWRLGFKAVTARLDLRFKRAVRVGDTVLFSGRVTGRKKRLLLAEADARSPDGEILATARATCILVGEGGA